MKILVTGGAGFIGSHLAEKLLDDGHTVCVIDNLSTGNRDNVAHLECHKNFRFFEDTLFHFTMMERLVSECECIYHLAAAVGVKYVIEHPIESIETNVRGTEILLTLASQYNRKVLFASTSEIYGKHEKVSLREDDDRVLGSTHIGRWSYSCTKALDEFLALAYHHERGLPVLIVRFFNICGPRQRSEYGMVVPRFVKAALCGEPIEVYGDGRQTRSFTYINDAVRGVTALMGCDNAVGQVVNLGSDEGITIFELAEKIKKLTNSSSEIIFIPYEKAYEAGFEDMRHRKPDISKIRELTGYSPTLTLDQILVKVVEYFKEKGMADAQ